MAGFFFQRFLKPLFPVSVCYGDIVRGLSIPPDSCDAIFCSHVLEHLSLEDCRVALRNTRCYLKAGGIFRLVVPDLEQLVADYQSNPNPEALFNFLSWSQLGRRSRPKGLVLFAREFLGNSHHLWMWDYKALAQELQSAGFTGIRRCQFGDSANPAFLAVENAKRFEHGLGIECTK